MNDLQQQVLDLFSQVAAIKNSDELLFLQSIGGTNGGTKTPAKITLELLRKYLTITTGSGGSGSGSVSPEVVENLITIIEEGLNAERQRAQQAENSINAQIGTDSTAGTVKGRIKELEDTVGNDLSQRISDAVAAETSRAQRAEGDLSQQISTSIAAETTRAQQAEENLRQLYESLTEGDTVVMTAAEWAAQDWQTTPGQARTIYRVAGTNSYADYMFNATDLTTPILMATYDNAIDDEPTAGSGNLVKSGGIYKAINIFEDILPDGHLGNYLSYTQTIGQAPQYGAGGGGTDKYGPYTTQKEITFDIIASGYYGFALVGADDKIVDYTSSNSYSEATSKEWIVPVGYYLLLSTSKSQHVKARVSDIKIINGKVIECERTINTLSTIATCDNLVTSAPVDGSFVLSTGAISYVSGWKYCAFDVSKIKAGTYIGIYGRSESSKCLGAWEDGDGNRTPIIMTAASKLSKGEKFLKQSDAVRLYVNSRTSDFNAIIVYSHPYQFADVVNEDYIYDWVAVADMPIEGVTKTGYYIDSEGNEHETSSSYYYKTFDIKDYKYGSTLVFSGRTMTDGVIGRLKFKDGTNCPILLPSDSTVYKDISISIPFDATEISLNSTVDADWQLTVSVKVSGFMRTAKYASKELNTEVDEIGKTVDEISSTMFTEDIKDYSIPGTPSEPNTFITDRGVDSTASGWFYKRYSLKPYYEGHQIAIDGKSAFNHVIGRWNYQDGTNEVIVMTDETPTVYTGYVMDIPDNAVSIDVQSPTSVENKAVAKQVLVKEENYIRKGGSDSNYYSGKTIWWCGTSIPAGNTSSNYPKMVGEILGADVINVAVSGSMCRANVRTGINETVGSYKGAVFENISSALTMTNQEIEDFISDYSNIKGRLRGYGSPSSGIPESLEATNLNRLRAASFEKRLLPYLNGEYPMPDLFVIDHGHNDFKYTLYNGTTDIGLEPIRTNISKNQSEANTILEEDTYMTKNNYANLKSFFNGLSHVNNSNGTGENNFINSDFDRLACSLNRNCYKGAVNFLVTLILTYNPQARIVFISNYEHEHGDHTTYAPLITAQNDIAESWAFPLFEVYKYLGFSNHIIPGSKAFLAQHGYTFANDVDMFKIYCPDTVHPHSDQTGHANEVYAGVLSEFIKTCR